MEPERLHSLSHSTADNHPNRVNNDGQRSRSQSYPAEANWPACAAFIKQHDEQMTKNWKEDIDTLLVFAGLFSAVVTAFATQSYAMLQQQQTSSLPNSGQGPSLQGNSTSVNGSIISSQGIMHTLFEPSPSVIRINILWFYSLVCSLISSLLAILAKQWLREYMCEGSSTPRETIRIRQHRFDGLTTWHVSKLIAFPPILLQCALVLFFFGLIEFLWFMDALLAGLVSIPIAAALIFHLATSLAPAFSTACPYRSPQSWAFLLLIQNLCNIYHSFQSMAMRCVRRKSKSRKLKPLLDWRDRDIKTLPGRRNELDNAALEWAYMSSMDDDFLDSLVPCINDLRPAQAAAFAFTAVASAANCSVPTLIETARTSSPLSTQLCEILILRRLDGRRVSRLVKLLLDILPRIHHKNQSSGIIVIDTIAVLQHLLMWNAKAFCERALHREALTRMMELVNIWEPLEVQRAALDVIWKLTTSGCNVFFCPDAIVNVIMCARQAFSRGDSEMFCRACAVVFQRLPALDTAADQYDWYMRGTLHGWLSDVRRFLVERNRLKAPYNCGTHVRWCAGLGKLAAQDREIIPAEMVATLSQGAALGLLGNDDSEAEALQDLQRMYALDTAPPYSPICSTGTTTEVPLGTA
ncbi:hypothetical protein CERSUDRAFT_117454 [Gelatoporia subvermispora B]|uniref:DUF6535 domain-containing protein n=1 Tax=Ceriporiopsis subvermispora (strain B) TaxID=914234 RepID=M2R4X1_CERS8|nr:hypothetical protein CERSUDRAFT_117454 [Gelatoporia subvermispora B]